MKKTEYLCAAIIYKMLKYLRQVNDLASNTKLKFGPLGDDISFHHLCFGAYEGEIVKIAQQKLRDRNKKGAFIDIGAHIGSYTVTLQSQAQKVYSFEPNKNIFQVLEANVAAYDNVTAFNIALSEKAEWRLFEPTELNSGKSRIVKQRSNSSIKIETKKLDDFYETIQDVTLIKIDTEGHELEILRGGVNIIRRDKPVIMLELLADSILNGEAEALTLLEGLGYKNFIWLSRYSKLEEILRRREITKPFFYTLHAFLSLVRNPLSVRREKLVNKNIPKLNYEMILCE